MKKFIIRYRIIPVMVCVLLLTQSVAYAQDAQTKAQIIFTAGEGPTKPVHPEYPDIEENVDEGIPGSLAIVKVSYFDFGTVPLSYKREWHPIETTRPNIQVVDLRGTNVGWKVSASVTGFVDDDMQDSLPGASILISKGRPNSLSVSPPPAQTENLQLTADGETFPVVTAQPGAGIGLWIMRWYPKIAQPENSEDPEFPEDPEDPEAGEPYPYIHLEIPPGSAQLGNHTAEINWILENTPVA